MSKIKDSDNVVVQVSINRTLLAKLMNVTLADTPEEAVVKAGIRLVNSFERQKGRVSPVIYDMKALGFKG